MKATLLCLFLAHAHAFEVLSGDCRLDTPLPWMFVVPNQPICIKQPRSSRAGDCRILAPAGLALSIDEFDLRGGDALLVNGVNYTGTIGPAGIVPTGELVWHESGTGSSDFQLCRPAVPHSMYAVTLFVYAPACISTWWFLFNRQWCVSLRCPVDLVERLLIVM